MTGLPATALRTMRSPLIGVVLACAALIAGLIAFAILGQSRSAPTEAVVQPGGPSGVITFELGSGEDISVTAAGKRLSSPRTVNDDEDSDVSGPERWASPDGRTTVSAQRTSDGVFLASGAVPAGAAAWIAGPDSPALVDGGKAPAAAVKGVPLVVAWSPDSQLIAYGSLTGEPYYLNVAPPSSLASPRSLSLEGGYVGELVWSPDGRYLGISTYTMDRKNHTTFIYDRLSGSVMRLIDGCHITWSPDSRYVAVHRDPSPEPGTWVVAVDGTQRYALTNDATAYPELWQAS